MYGEGVMSRILSVGVRVRARQRFRAGSRLDVGHGIGRCWARGMGDYARGQSHRDRERRWRNGRDHDLHFVYYDLPQWARGWKRGAAAFILYYALWQWGAYRTAKRLTTQTNFDCVHHVTFVGVRAPSFMGRLGLPFFLGPVSGGECVPKTLRTGMTRTAKWRESLRDVANRVVRCDPVMRSSFRRAESIFLATPESLRLIPSQIPGEMHGATGSGAEP